jgi:hypothetical protein
MQSSLPAGWLAFTGRESNPLDHNKRFQITHPPFLDLSWRYRDFLRNHGIGQADIDTVWTAIALHTTPGIPQHMHPVVALVTAGVEMDVLGLAYGEYSAAERDAVVHAHPRNVQFKEDIIQAFYDGMKHRPDTTFGTVNADVLADKDPAFRRGNFCSVIRGSAWNA